MHGRSDRPMEIDTFIRRWETASGSELANYQIFVGDLCALLDVEKPEPSRDQAAENAYVFERGITFTHVDGSTSAGRIDCYRRGAFVLEAKKVRQSPGRGFDDAMLRARTQAEQYARALPLRRGQAPNSGGGRRRQRHRALCRVQPDRRHLHAVPRPAIAPHPAGRFSG